MATASVAWLTCTLAGAAAHRAARSFAQQSYAWAGVLCGMIVRMALPLAVCVWAYTAGGILPDRGIALYLLVFYMVALAIWVAESVSRASGTRLGHEEA
jgi:hypothetical protein